MIAVVLAIMLAATASPSPTPTPSPPPPPTIITVHGTPTFTLQEKLLPTPPPSVLKRTKFIFEEDMTQKHWLFLPNVPEERYVKMYVTSMKRFGPVHICRGWVVLVPMAGTESSIVTEDQTFICSGRMKPFHWAGSSPSPSPSPVPK